VVSSPALARLCQCRERRAFPENFDPDARVCACAHARSFDFSKHPRRADSLSRKAVCSISLVRLSIAVKWNSTIIFQLRGVVLRFYETTRKTDSAWFVRAFNSIIIFEHATITEYFFDNASSALTE